MPNSDLTPDTLYATADALAETVPVEHLDGVCATLEYLHHAPRDISIEALRNLSPCALTEQEAQIVILRLETEGILTDDHLDDRALHLVFGAARLLATEDAPPENTVVATIPYDDRALDQSMFKALHDNMLSLIRSAEDNLVLMSPFLSERAYRRLRPALHTATDNGADVTVITRYLTYGGDDGEYNRKFVTEVLEDRYLGNYTTCYEYIDDETWTTFHAKLVLADNHTAYLGTANITHKGLGDNLELGVIFRDRTTERFAALVDALQESELLHQVVCDSGQFIRV
ncbi:phospholipase D-like domain-containing protein [Natronobacterium gregoryi]|uniref:PLD phosphodiesterase domain-containing protein n=2 Tax=Natronobacterium gregoryi TaxID=44930 RepID=L0AIM8_NATGS|nr:phospholipase D-like domain-containing protein [Natronobacterium gregoryi]AFZ73743.1 hypothetical protein Natgr_2591 [Natronobacterium gregoryi SP2]ELY65802.1 hypothetical protein C490_13521 [Natronobacterium gregoryi SP2]PLK19432.1 hypothetical protein CYV19_14805 [Natronobacterium gregoryi SP2]SFJ48104.1 PLD-like domain-containing protein [Natronobacterium gregoryi]